MPLVLLSSRNEADPTKFSNKFNPSLVIEPFSKICFIKGQITRLDQGKKILIPPDTTMSVRFSPYDIHTITYNIGGTEDETLSIEAFITQTSVLIGNNLMMNRTANWNFDSPNIGDHENLRFEFKWINATHPNYEDFMYGNENYRRTFWNSVSADGGRNLPNGAVVGTNSTAIGGNGGAANWAAGIGWDLTKYTVPPNMNNGSAHTMLLDGQGETRTQFIIGQPNLKDVDIVIGKTTNFGTPNWITVGPIKGTPGFDTPAAVWGRCLFRVNFKDNGVMDIYNWDTNINNFYHALQDAPYQPGERWQLHGIGTPHTGITDERHYFYLSVARTTTNGLAALVPLRTENLAGNSYLQFNNTAPGTGRAKPIPLDVFYEPYLSSNINTLKDEALDLRFMGDDSTGQLEFKATGYRICNGFSKDTSGEANANTNESINIDLVALTNLGNTPVLTGSPLTYANGSLLVQRYAPADPAGPNPSHKGAIDFQLADFNLNQPFFASYFCRFFDDTAQIPGGTANHMCVFGSDTAATSNQFLTLDISNTEAWDAKIHWNDGTTDQNVLQDGGGTPITFNFTDDFWINVSLVDPSAAGRVRIVVWNLTTNTEYSALIAIGAKVLPKLRYYAGSDPTGGANLQSHFAGYVSDLRFYERCTDALLPPNYWQSLEVAITTFLRTAVQTLEGTYWGNARNETLLPDAAMLGADGKVEQKYCCFGLPRSSTTKTLVFQKGNNTAQHSAYYEFINVYGVGNTLMKNADRDTTLDANDYNEAQLGLVNTTGEIDAVVDFIEPQEDGDGNVLINRNSEPYPVNNIMATLEVDVDNVALEHENINVEITNLPHRTFNGCSETIDKTIYQMPMVSDDSLDIDNLEILDHTAPTKCWVDLNNAGQIPINKLDVQLSDINGTKLSMNEYKQETNLVVEIKGQKEFLN